MKHALLIIALMAVTILAETPEGEWQISRGEWEKIGPSSFRGESGLVVWKPDSDSTSWQITMTITVLSWERTKKVPDGTPLPPPFVGIMWGPNALLLAPGRIQIGPPANPEKKIPWTVPTKRPIAILLKANPDEIEANVGGKHMKVKLSNHKLESLRLHTNGLPAIFSDIKLTVNNHK